MRFRPTLGACLLASGACIWACADKASVGNGSGLAFYLVADSTRTTPPSAEELEALELLPEPILTEKDITRYVWTAPGSVRTHSFEVTDDALQRLASVGYRPFVVTVGDERVYVGTFWGMERSLHPAVPFIYVGPFLLQPLRINEPRNMAEVPLRELTCADSRVRDALRAAGVLVDSEDTPGSIPGTKQRH